MPISTTGTDPPTLRMSPTLQPASPSLTGALDHLSWEDLSRHAKHLENSLDSKLLTLGRLTSAALRRHRYDSVVAAGREGDVLRQAEELAQRVEAELDRLGGMVEALATRCGEAGGATLHILQRHRDIHAEYLKEYRKTREHITSARDTANMYACHGEGRSRGRVADPDHSKSPPLYDVQAQLLNEQQHLDSAQQHTDHIINVAYAAQSGIQQQRFTILESGRKMHSLTDRFPVINQLMLKMMFRTFIAFNEQDAQQSEVVSKQTTRSNPIFQRHNVDHELEGIIMPFIHGPSTGRHHFDVLASLWIQDPIEEQETILETVIHNVFDSE